MITNSFLYLLLNGAGVLLFGLAAAFIHELGHALTIWFFTKKRPVMLSHNKPLLFIIGNFYFNCDELTDKQYILTLAAGILSGLLVIFLISFSLHFLFFYILLGAYFFSCKADIQALIELMDEGNND